MSFSKSQDSCASLAWSIAPANSDMPQPARCLYVGVGGDVRVTTTQGNDVTFVGVSGGAVLPVSVKRVWATSTTATSIVGMI